MDPVEVEGSSREAALDRLLQLLGSADISEIEILEERSVRKFFGLGGRSYRLSGRLRSAVDKFVEQDEFEDVSEDQIDLEFVSKSKETDRVVAESDSYDKVEREATKAEILYKPWRGEKGKGRSIGLNILSIPTKGRGYKNRLYSPTEYIFEELNKADQFKSSSTPDFDQKESSRYQRKHQVYKDDRDSSIDYKFVKAGIVFIEKVFSHIEDTAKVKAYRIGDRIVFDIFCKERSFFSLTDRKGELLDTVQYLAGLVINRLSADRIRVVVDSQGYREQRLDNAVSLGLDLAKKAISTRRIVSLPPMPPAERREVHMALKDFDGIFTESEGEGDRRRVLIKPEQQPRPYNKKGAIAGRKGGRSPRR